MDFHCLSWCSDALVILASNNGFIDISFFGPKNGSSLMFKHPITLWTCGLDFASYFAGQRNIFMAKFRESTSKYNSIHDDVWFYWLGKSKIFTEFHCLENEECFANVYLSSGNWVSVAMSSPSITRDTRIRHAMVERQINTNKLDFSFNFSGPAKATVYFNEVRLLVNLYQRFASPRPKIRPAKQKICKFNENGVPEGLFYVKLSRQ
ncbi:hypothetical protein DSO57_1036433 [Entomophthora muscae]|uniref:Uncharacterized protein n=1 Tax=Entomophthora muscae TaxID=34485 RepID=A0ACC2S157_9FUNG|nr:hypothetical protein DSO57_1036433 [Entomophthora muscae]